MEPEGQVVSDETIRARNILKRLTAAVEIFSRKGLDGVRIVEIARLRDCQKEMSIINSPRNKRFTTQQSTG